MCKNAENGAELPIATQSMRFRNGTGPPHWRNGLRALACAGLWYDFGTGQSRPRALACGAILRKAPGQRAWDNSGEF